ncbi:TetR/AcrR family transcriptional regulator [Vibrio superstes]|uniref:TetR family transcriptional regulator n=1 Tax=Vibrio superstes NBRC 103154 TaxID=1219062 RepID=A0A511QTZ9_9VIBR|nr:TetR/AcrR family transcriptional regulator [Vibrio superstes]GEM80286.1 TetR family transcriptional regulator [Vibrio superstes NBRC 103154]
MNQRKQGRRTAEEAERTKLKILTSAAFLFCEKGYNQVTIRDISEKAGVTHGLIRHYFGVKNQIWSAIIQSIHEYMSDYTDKLNEAISADLPIRQRVYLFLSYLMGYMLRKPQMIQIMLDYIHHPENEIEELDKHLGEMRSNIQKLVEMTNTCAPDVVRDGTVNSDVVMWQFMIHAGGATAFKPFMAITWPGKDEDECLLAHWRLYEQQIAVEYQIEPQHRLAATKLQDVILDIRVMDEETEAMFQSHFTGCVLD